MHCQCFAWSYLLTIYHQVQIYRLVGQQIATQCTVSFSLPLRCSGPWAICDPSICFIRSTFVINIDIYLDAYSTGNNLLDHFIDNCTKACNQAIIKGFDDDSLYMRSSEINICNTFQLTDYISLQNHFTHKPLQQSQGLMWFISIIQIYSIIASGRVLDGELLYTKILEGEPRWLERNLHETVCRQMQTN